MEYYLDGASYGRVSQPVESCLGCRHWSGRCSKLGVASVLRWRRGRVTDPDGAVWFFGDSDGTPDQPCPRRRKRE